MDKQGNRKSHSEEKLLVYEEYLKAYLGILNNVNFFNAIHIWDVFSGNGEGGSPLVAINIIKKLEKKKEIKLYLNDKNNDSYQKLKKLVDDEKADQFTKVFNLDGTDFIDKVSTAIRGHLDIRNLFFIDPFGYTQYSQENLRKLFALQNSEYFIFIPIFHIYRFKNEDDKSAKNFLLELGIKKNTIAQENNIQDLSNDLKEIFIQKAKTEFVYDYQLENRDNNNKYLLLFVTKHIKGAHKFLEAKNKVKNEVEKQGLLFNPKEESLKDFLQNFLKDWKTNRLIYEKGIKEGFLPKEFNPILKDWEKNESIEIKADFQRRKGYFYIDNRKKTIKIKLCQK